MNRFSNNVLEPVFKRKLQGAHEKPTYAAAKAALQPIRAERAPTSAVGGRRVKDRAMSVRAITL